MSNFTKEISNGYKNKSSNLITLVQIGAPIFGTPKLQF